MIKVNLKKDLLLNQSDLKPLDITLPDNFDLIESYSSLCKCNLNTLKNAYINRETKCYVLYVLCQSVEILFKYLLLVFASENPENLSSYEHRIYKIYDKLVSNPFVFDSVDRTIYFMIIIILDNLSELKNDKGKSLLSSFDSYLDLRYNHKKNSNVLIIKSKLSKNDCKIIEEVIKCMEEIITLI